MEDVEWERLRELFEHIHKVSLETIDQKMAISSKELKLVLNSTGLEFKGDLSVYSQKLADVSLELGPEGLTVSTTVPKWKVDDDGVVVVDNATIALSVGCVGLVPKTTKQAGQASTKTIGWFGNFTVKGTSLSGARAHSMLSYRSSGVREVNGALSSLGRQRQISLCMTSWRTFPRMGTLICTLMRLHWSPRTLTLNLKICPFLHKASLSSKVWPTTLEFISILIYSYRVVHMCLSEEDPASRGRKRFQGHQKIRIQGSGLCVLGITKSDTFVHSCLPS